MLKVLMLHQNLPFKEGILSCARYALKPLSNFLFIFSIKTTDGAILHDFKLYKPAFSA